VEKSKLTLNTHECFYIVQGNPNTPPAMINDTVDRLISLTKQYCGGNERILMLAE
jgi:DNA/RNA-binding domain of Phe-tRNA-synthetase-like protein